MKTLIYHGYRSFEYASLINSGLLVFLRLISDQEVCFGVPKFSFLSISKGTLLGFLTVVLFTPEKPPWDECWN